jgi:hypothetical protein
MALWLAVGLAGCGKSQIEVVAFEQGAPGTGTLTFTSEADGSAFVRWGPPGKALTNETAAAPAADGGVTVLGLPTGDTVEMVVVIGSEESDPFEVDIPAPAREVIPFTQSAWEPSQACLDGGYVLFSYLGNGTSGVGIIDRDGDYVFSLDWPAEEQVARVRPGRDGQSMLFNVADAAKIDDVARIVRVDLLGGMVSETRTEQGHHDFVEKSPGRFAWLGYDMRDIPAPPNDFGIDGEICLAMDTIFEADEQAGDGQHDEVWNGWEDYAPGAYTIPDGSVNCNGGSCQPSFLKNGCYEFGHGNSLAYLASEDAYYMNWRWLDVTFKVPGDGGTAWQWGGDHSDFALDPTTAFDGSHFSDVWSGGMMMFDNRSRALGSRLVEYSFDDTGYDELWQHVEPTGAYENLLGDVQRIPGCDNLLVSWSGQAKIQEITREGEVVWEVVSPEVGNVTSRLFFVPDLYDLSGIGYSD